MMQRPGVQKKEKKTNICLSGFVHTAAALLHTDTDVFPHTPYFYVMTPPPRRESGYRLHCIYVVSCG